MNPDFFRKYSDLFTESEVTEQAATVAVTFFNSGTGEQYGKKEVQNLGLSLDASGQPVMTVSSPYASGNKLQAYFDAAKGGWFADLD
jgi:hypothetical protein